MGCHDCNRDYRDRYHDRHRDHHDCKSCHPQGNYPPRGYYPPRRRSSYEVDIDVEYERTSNIYVNPPRFYR